jgi:protein tyrosine phosphatase
MSYPYLDRYSDIKPYKFNTVQISSKTGYINASPINIRDKKNYFISTQGPKPETVEDFWTMVSDYNSNVIVMLCKVTEGGRRKCENYWEAKNMKNFNINVEKEENFDMYVIRTIKLKNLDKKEERIVYQLHFTGWPDHGIPDTEKGNGKVFWNENV